MFRVPGVLSPKLAAKPKNAPLRNRQLSKLSLKHADKWELSPNKTRRQHRLKLNTEHS